MDAFDKLAAQLNILPEQVAQAYYDATVEEVDKAATKLHTYLNNNCDSKTLRNPANQIIDNTMVEIGGKPARYVATVDWDDTKPVNELKAKGGAKHIRRNKKRRRGKRDYSINPATAHDLAYILNYGVKNDDGTTRTLGNHFIDKGLRRIRNLNKNIEINFERRIDIIAAQNRRK